MARAAWDFSGVWRLATSIVLAGLALPTAMAQPADAAADDAALPVVAPEYGDDARAGSDAQPPASEWHGRVELKRQNTSRGTEDESTKTTLRIESFLTGAVRSLRLDLQFPDEKTSFEGSPFHPRPGDTKIRVGFQPLRAGAYTLPSFVELTLPTADPDTLGAGKVQLSAGMRMLVPVTLPIADPKPHDARFEVELQQTNSVGGDENRKDINYTKLELTFYDLWRKTYLMKLKLKPSVDWTRDGQTGAVGEVEGGGFFAQHWRSWLMLGRRLWGPDGIGGTYDTRLELGLARTF
jgi:hypothetical protein